jgi:hypothetical protein
VVAAVGLVTGCGAAGSGESTVTSVPVTTSTTQAVTTTTTSTTTTMGETTTTTPETTTTATETSTTVAGGEAVVVGAAGVLGWWDGNGWAATGEDAPVEGGEAYQVFEMGRLVGEATGTAPAPSCEPIPEAVGVDLTPDPWQGGWGPFSPRPVAVTAPWDATPHQVVPINPTDEYSAAASELLAARGVDDPAPPFVQLLRVDLDGDGRHEVLGVIERRTGGGEGLNPAPAGDYSLAFAMVDGATAVLDEWIVEEQPEGWIQDLVVFRINAVLDADGDGVDEIALGGSYYEGWGESLWDWQGPAGGFEAVAGTGCGV